MKNNIYEDITYGFITAILFSAFIYLENFGITNKFLNTIFGLLALIFLLYIPKKAVLAAGFFIGLFWFYWVGYSFEYNGVGFLAPFVTLLFGVICMLLFGILALSNKIYIRAILLFGISFIEPFDWNWMQIELLFVDSYIGVHKFQLFLVLLALSLPSFMHKCNKYKYTPLLLLILTYYNMPYSQMPQLESELKIKLVHTDIKQDYKWSREALEPTIKMIFKEIQDAIDNNYELIVFPESVFALLMNKNENLINILNDYSYKISIVAGSLIREKGNNYNVTYMFENGDYQIAKKLILVPFGEYIPLPKFAQAFINKHFFAGAADFQTASQPTDFIIKGVKFRNAICFEATCQELYEGDVNFMIATSNNAWFTPSIEPTIQKLLMRYYARKNGVTIYHSANYKGTGIVK